MIHTAKAQCQGMLKEDKGTLTAQSDNIDKIKYSFITRFEDAEKGTNPEELLAASHAGCFTMSVASIFDRKGLIPTSLDTTATLTLEGLSIKAIHLSITGSVKGIEADEFAAVIKEAEQICMVSKVQRVAITSESHFVA